MKKIFTLFSTVLFAAGMFAQSYGIAVNGTTYYAGTQNLSPLDPSFQEYMVLGLAVPAGQLIWMVLLRRISVVTAITMCAT